MEESMSIEQLIDYVNNELTFYGVYDKILPDLAIRGIIQDDALQYFYNEYNYAHINSFLKIPLECVQYSQNYYQDIILPVDVNAVLDVFKMNRGFYVSSVILNAGSLNFPISMGAINQPYLASQMSTIGDIGTYRSIISSFADEITKMTKENIGFDFNHNSKRIIFNGAVDSDLLLRVSVRIPPEYLYNDEMFKKYVVATARLKLADVLELVALPMPGNFNFSASALRTKGEADLLKVEERIKKQAKATIIKIRR